MSADTDRWNEFLRAKAEALAEIEPTTTENPA